MSLRNAILETLALHRNGLTVYQIHQTMNWHADLSAMAPTVCNMVRLGLLRNDGQEPCGNCGTRHVVYRIAENGRIKLNNGG